MRCQVGEVLVDFSLRDSELLLLFRRFFEQSLCLFFFGSEIPALVTVCSTFDCPSMLASMPVPLLLTASFSHPQVLFLPWLRSVECNDCLLLPHAQKMSPFVLGSLLAVVLSEPERVPPPSSSSLRSEDLVFQFQQICLYSVSSLISRPLKVLRQNDCVYSSRTVPLFPAPLHLLSRQFRKRFIFFPPILPFLNGSVLFVFSFQDARCSVFPDQPFEVTFYDWYSPVLQLQALADPPYTS